jgi:hypothetical protein
VSEEDLQDRLTDRLERGRVLDVCPHIHRDARLNSGDLMDPEGRDIEHLSRTEYDLHSLVSNDFGLKNF